MAFGSVILFVAHHLAMVPRACFEKTDTALSWPLFSSKK